MWNRITDKIIFSYVDINYYVLDSTFMLTGENLKFLIAILNSNLISFWIKFSAAALGEGSYGAKIYIENAPIPKISEPDQKPFVDLVDKILEITKDEDYPENQEKQGKVKKLEEQIDQMVYKIYELTKEEIKVIETNDK